MVAEQPKFVLNNATVAAIAKSDPGLIAAVNAAAQKVRAAAASKHRVTVDYYTTDRHVAGVVCRAIDQVKHGALTRAVGRVGGRLVQHD